MKYFLTLFILCFTFYSRAQEIVKRDRKLTSQVTEQYNVLKSDYSVFQGQYAAYLKKTLIAAGNYSNNKKTGTWTFFNKQGKLCQRYNYDNQTLVFEAPPDSTTRFVYIVDDSLKNNPRFTRPVRIGGSYYGYLNYINLVRLPKDYWNLSNQTSVVSMEILVSPFGRLAEFKIRIRPIVPDFYVEDALLNLNIKLLDDDDKFFVPATLNGEQVAVRVVIPCRFVGADKIEML
ncbi:hypothetical protein [Mucilaginibacter terrae]|uniref:TonB C-terminal domain-containing protein n=1 Tax=Mucilaginibacter terrae TaxID=1955052 RepID=A0ABU3GPV2_9SPHI|nr:hypothetical protein [Mucilaginibacter terrae]MDT3401809.1 hypothetical protein [Mucilaginibacter terrae]